jgi:phage antirepressor YoqD-like protein
MVLADFKPKLNKARDLIRTNGIISETDLYALLEIGYNKFYMIKKALKMDREFVYQNGFFSLRQLTPQKTLDEHVESGVIGFIQEERDTW